MPVSKAQQRAVGKYVKENYDRVEVKMPKGYKATVQNHAAAQGESVNGFINRAIIETIDRDRIADARPPPTPGELEGAN